MARQIVDQGFLKVRPLLGGFDAWVDKGYPMEMLQAEDEEDRRLVEWKG